MFIRTLTFAVIFLAGLVIVFPAMTMLFTNERSLRSTNSRTRTFPCHPHADPWFS